MTKTWWVGRRKHRQGVLVRLTVIHAKVGRPRICRLLLHFIFLRGWIGASSVEETPRPRIMQTWWIGRSRQGLGRAGRVYRNSCQNRQAMNLQTFLPLALSEGIFGRPVWTRCRIPVRLDEDALYISLSVDFGIMWLSIKGRGLSCCCCNSIQHQKRE